MNHKLFHHARKARKKVSIRERGQGLVGFLVLIAMIWGGGYAVDQAVKSDPVGKLEAKSQASEYADNIEITNIVTSPLTFSSGFHPYAYVSFEAHNNNDVTVNVCFRAAVEITYSDVTDEGRTSRTWINGNSQDNWDCRDFLPNSTHTIALEVSDYLNTEFMETRPENKNLRVDSVTIYWETWYQHMKSTKGKRIGY